MRKLAVWAAALYMFVTLGFPDRPALTQSVTLLLAICFILSRVEVTRVRLPSGAMVALLLYTGWVGLSLLWTPDQGIGFYVFWRQLVIVMFALIAWNVVKDLDDVAILIQGYVGGAFLVFISLYRNVSAGKGLWGAGSSGQMRFSAEGFQPNAVAWILAFATILSWTLIIWNRKPTRIFLLANYAMPVVAIIGTLSTGSRGGAIALVLAFIPILLYFWKRPLGAVAITTGAIMFLPAVLVSDRLQGSIQRILSSTSSAESDGLSGRLDLWQAAIEIALRNPFIGSGVGGFNQGSTELALNTSSGVNGAHQAFLAVTSETGLVGLVLFCAFCYQVFLCVKRLPKDTRPFAFGLLAALFSVLLFSHQHSSHIVLFPTLMLMLADVVSQHRASEAKSTTAQTIEPSARGGRHPVRPNPAVKV